MTFWLYRYFYNDRCGSFNRKFLQKTLIYSEALLVLTFALLGSSYGETVLSEVTPSWLMIQLIVVVYFCYLLLQNLTEKK